MCLQGLREPPGSVKSLISLLLGRWHGRSRRIPTEQQVPGALFAIRLHKTLERQVFYSEIVHLFRNARSATRLFFRCSARLQRSSRLTSVFGTGSTRESRLPLHVFQPQSNPKYHCSRCLYGSLALFETPNHALQLVENTLLTSLITQSSVMLSAFRSDICRETQPQSNPK